MYQKTRFLVLERDNFTCQYCGRKAPEVILEIDHIIPKNYNGTDDIDNLITACRDCNYGKFDSIKMAKVECLTYFKNCSKTEIKFTKSANHNLYLFKLDIRFLKESKYNTLLAFCQYLENHDGIFNQFDLKYKYPEETEDEFNERYLIYTKDEITKAITELEKLEDPMDILNFEHPIFKLIELRSWERLWRERPCHITEVI
jgi:hypothetical protein